MYTPLKGLTNNMSKDVVSPFAQLSLKPSALTPKSRHASTSSSTSSTTSQRLMQNQNSYRYGDVSENAIIDDDDDLTRNDIDTLFGSPNILATSTDHNTGRLLPSLSTISLLSLNRENMDLGSESFVKRKSNSRQPSFSSARAPPFQIHQQRHQQYYSNNYAHSRRTSTQIQQQQQPIPINGMTCTPDTPTFGPTSLANSPSGFILSQQQLPNSYQQQRHAFPGMTRNNSNTQPMLVTGNMSPFLNPIQGEQVPMTPLMLSGSDQMEEQDVE